MVFIDERPYPLDWLPMILPWGSCGKFIVLLLFLSLLSCATATAQTFQFLPEIDANAKIQPDIRFNFQTKETREAGDPTQAEVGPGFDFFLKPLVRLKRVTVFDLDDAKSRPLQFSVGFRYVPSPDKPHIERMIVAVTPRWPLMFNILLTDRNRADLDWEENQFSWRYRNRLTLERRIAIRSYHPAPYISAEVFYQSQYQKWSTTALYAGAYFPSKSTSSWTPATSTRTSLASDQISS